MLHTGPHCSVRHALPMVLMDYWGSSSMTSWGFLIKSPSRTFLVLFSSLVFLSTMSIGFDDSTSCFLRLLTVLTGIFRMPAMSEFLNFI
uniref:Uncharacterized protein n=1 Tax=Lepeophtheirus salmonis TaxID=72036 RepID=A0A0K2UFS3_LEPSM